MFGWCSVRRAAEVARSQVYASEQAQRGVVLTVVTAVAGTYIALRGGDRQLEIARATAANFCETQRIFDARFKAGLVSMTEVSLGTVAVSPAARGDPGDRGPDRSARILQAEYNLQAANANIGAADERAAASRVGNPPSSYLPAGLPGKPSSMRDIM